MNLYKVFQINDQRYKYLNKANTIRKKQRKYEMWPETRPMNSLNNAVPD